MNEFTKYSNETLRSSIIKEINCHGDILRAITSVSTKVSGNKNGYRYQKQISAEKTEADAEVEV